ncbi:MAG: transporter substrate-binding domain-containing protein [Lachnospiraceae bacterium]|nr:transporter substrate-binding domain-containing protein [Lachnospiraceae bacterium]
MKILKKHVILLVLLALITLVFAGCADTSDDASNNSDAIENDSTTDVEEEASAGEDDLLSSVRNNGKIVFAMEGQWAPWTYHDDSGELVGYDTDVARAIAEKLGVEAEFIEGEWDGLFAGLDGGRYDAIINGVEITDERKEKYDFTTPYAYIRTALVVADDNEDIKGFTDLKGKKSSNSLGSTYADLAEKYGAEVQNVDTLSETIDMLTSGRVDATLNAEVSFYDYLGEHPDAPIKIVALTDEASEVSIPLRKGAESAALKEEIDKAINELSSDGTLSELSNKYFGSDISQTSEAADSVESADSGSLEAILSEQENDELQAILDSGIIKVGVEGTYPPITYHDEAGELTGFDVDVAKAIAAKLGVEAEFTETEWDSLLASIDSGRIDTVINAVSVTDQRKEKYDFTEPYVSVYRNIIVKGDNDSINGPDDLNGTKVAENITTEYAEQLEELGATIVPIDTLQQAFDLVTSNRADFTILEDIQFYPYLEEHPDADLKIAFTIDDDVDQFAIPIKKGESRLLRALNAALDELKSDGTLSELSQKYFNSDVIEKASIQ